MLKIYPLFLLSAFVFLPAQGTTQTTANMASDPQAVVLANQAQAAIASGPVSDVLLHANAHWIAGSTSASGAATLRAKGAAEARLDLAAGAVTRSEIRNDANGPSGQWIGPDGARHPLALHNCWGPAGWFAPHALVQAMSGPNAVLRYVGREPRNGLSADHVQLHQTSTAKNSQLARDLEKLSAVEIFLDASTHAPVAVLFNIHPDSDDGRNIPVEIRFSDYRNVSGALVPFRIQRLLQGVLNLDLTVTSANINSGLADSEFALE